jgi:hypothetical protein
MQTEGTEVSRLGELVLAWLLTRSKGQGAHSEVSRALRPFGEHRWTQSEWSAQLEATLTALASAGLVQRTERKGLLLTPEGRARALVLLGVERLPKGTGWKQLKRTWLLARSLGLPASSHGQLATADGLRAVLIQRQLGLEGRGRMSLAQVRDALCWRQLGVDSERPFTLAAVQAVLLNRVLQAPREPQPSQALQLLAARGTGARRTDAESLRLAALRSWLLPLSEPSPAHPELHAAADTPPSVHEPEEASLRAFAERVLHAARTSTAGRFGEDKVFISHVWRALQGQGLDEPTFKQRLVEANRARLLSLSRADLVEAMDPSDVAASETRYLGATFHFIALQAPAA